MVAAFVCTQPFRCRPEVLPLPIHSKTVVYASACSRGLPLVPCHSNGKHQRYCALCARVCELLNWLLRRLCHSSSIPWLRRRAQLRCSRPPARISGLDQALRAAYFGAVRSPNGSGRRAGWLRDDPGGASSARISGGFHTLRKALGCAGDVPAQRRPAGRRQPRGVYLQPLTMAGAKPGQWQPAHSRGIAQRFGLDEAP